MFQFNDYLRICREQQNLSQSELVETLSMFDSSFSNLDTNTLSRWERGVCKPSVSKQTQLVRYFSERFDRIYPFIEQAERIQIEKSFCALGFSKLLGRHKLVMSFPTQHMDKKRFLIHLFNDSNLKQSALSKNLLIFQEMYGFALSAQTMEMLAKKPCNHFSICEYDGEYYGHFFAIKLTLEAFEQVLKFKMDVRTLEEKHLAPHNEKGCFLFFGFFGMSDLVISMLWVHFYSWVIKRQDNIQKMGAIISTKEGEMIARNMNTELYHTTTLNEKTYQSFCGNTRDMLITENIVKMLFNPENCPEE